MFKQLPKQFIRNVKPVVPFALQTSSRGIQKKWRDRRLRREPFDIVYVQTVVGLCGGVRVILEHASRLALAAIASRSGVSMATSRGSAAR